jgi:TolB-like protein
VRVVDAATAQRLGKLLGAQFMLTGMLTRLGAGMTTMEVVKMELDLPVPAEKFQAPGDIALKKQ